MTRDGGAKAKKQKWADWLNAQLREREWNAADLVTASGGALVYGTVYNWTKGTARVEAETVLVVAAALGVDASEALEAASYPLFAAAMAGRELRLVGAATQPTETPDPGIIKILSRDDLPDEVKATMIKWWNDRRADDDARRLADAERMAENMAGVKKTRNSA